MTTLTTSIKNFTSLNRAPGPTWTEATKRKAPHKPLLLQGTLRFICVDGDMDIHKAKSGGYKFSWDGNDEYDPASGSGEFTCDGDTLTGRIYIHDGDESSFVAKKIPGNGPSFP